MAGRQAGRQARSCRVAPDFFLTPPPLPLSPHLALQGNVFLQTQLAKRNEGREALEAQWRAQHKALQ